MGAQAQSIEGKVYEEVSGSPVEDALVQLIGSDITTETDSSGSFTIELHEAGTFNIRVSSFGHIAKLVTVNSGHSVVVKLDRVEDLEELLVLASTGQMQRNTVTNVVSRSVKELTMTPSTTLVQSITNMPGIYQTSVGVGIGKPVIRGLSGTRVVTYLNGLRIENQQWGLDHGMGVTDLGIGNVEIIKGPASLLYGVDAMGGVVYFVDEPYAKPNQIESMMSSRFESNTMGHNTQVGVKLGGNRLKLNLFGSNADHADYQLASGEYLKTSRFHTKALKASLGYTKGNWSSNLRYNLLDSRPGIPGHTHDSIIELSSLISSSQGREYTIPAQEIKNHYILWENKFYGEKSELSILTGHVSNYLGEYDEKHTIPGIAMNLNTTTFNANWKRELRDSLFLTASLQSMYQTNSNEPIAETVLVPDALTFDKAASVLLRKLVGKYSLEAGVRYDLRDISSTDRTDQDYKGSFSGINYSAGFARITTNHKIRANVSTGVRAPNTSELLAYGLHHGSQRFEIGNVSMTTEKATQFDVSWNGRKGVIDWYVNPFLNLVQDYIGIIPVDSLIQGHPVYEYQQLEKVRLYGLDAGVHYTSEYLEGLELFADFSMIEGNDGMGYDLPLIPQTRITGEVRYGMRAKKLKKAFASVQYRYFLPQDKVAVYEVASEAYQLTNIGLGIENGKKYPYEIKAGVRNLFNVNYMDHLSVLKNIGVPNPGRNIYLSLKVSFNKSKN